MRLAAIATVVILVAGCAPRYVHCCKTAADFEVDKTGCLTKIGYGQTDPTNTLAIWTAGGGKEFYERCMSERGWTRAVD